MVMSINTLKAIRIIRKREVSSLLFNLTNLRVGICLTKTRNATLETKTHMQLIPRLCLNHVGHSLGMVAQLPGLIRMLTLKNSPMVLSNTMDSWIYDI